MTDTSDSNSTDEEGGRHLSAAGEETGDGDEKIGILDVRERIMSVSEELLEKPIDGITSIKATDEGQWRTVFEVVERSAVPDTQDIIGRYEIYLSSTGEVKEYSLQRRFKRSESQDNTL
jgi:hypothetical protein